MSSDPSLPATVVKAEPETDEVTRTHRLPPYNVILENDDDHSFEFVIMVLCKALGFSIEKAFLCTEEAHNSGCAVVWTGAKEVAELKAEQIQTFHEIRERDNRDLGPLGCRIEPAPGA